MNVQNQEILFHKPLSTIQSKRILHHLKQFDVDIMIDKDEYMFVHDVYADNIQHESRMGCYKLCEVDDLEAACQFPLNKILISAKPCYLKQHFEEMAEPFSNCLLYTSVATHGGLETGVFKGKIPDLDIVTMGPNMSDIHTPDEKLELESFLKTYQLLVSFIETL